MGTSLRARSNERVFHLDVLQVEQQLEHETQRRAQGEEENSRLHREMQNMQASMMQQTKMVQARNWFKKCVPPPCFGRPVPLLGSQSAML